MTDETEFIVKGPFHWAEIVRLMENLREHPEQWEEARVWRQFSQTVMTYFVARLHQIRVSNTLPKMLAGFDLKVGRNCKFFSTPASTEFTFADHLEWYLRANDRDKKGKAIILSVGSTATTDSFPRSMEGGVTRTSLGLAIKDGNGLTFLQKFEVDAT